MRYKMQSLDSYSGIVGLINYQFYNTTHYVQMSRISQGSLGDPGHLSIQSVAERLWLKEN